MFSFYLFILGAMNMVNVKMELASVSLAGMVSTVRWKAVQKVALVMANVESMERAYGNVVAMKAGMGKTAVYLLSKVVLTSEIMIKV